MPLSLQMSSVAAGAMYTSASTPMASSAFLKSMTPAPLAPAVRSAVVWPRKLTANVPTLTSHEKVWTSRRYGASPFWTSCAMVMSPAVPSSMSGTSP